MIETSYINPFNGDAREIVRKLGDVNNLDVEDEQLKDLIKETNLQNLTSAMVPNTIKQLALKKFEWYLLKDTKKFDHKNYMYLFNPDIYEYDVVSFYLLCQIVAIEFGADSHEAKQVIQMQAELMKLRLEKLANETTETRDRFYREALAEVVDTSKLYWYDIKDVLAMGEIDFNKLLIVDGRIIVEYEDFIEEFGDKIEGRYPLDVYNITAGAFIKSKLLISIVMLKTKNYMQTVHEMSKKMVEPNPIMKTSADEIRDIQQKAQQLRFGSGSGMGGGSFADNKPTPYDTDAFAPCVAKCMQGIKSGGRNDAIVLFLTPFLSYARLYPGVFAQQRNIKISEVDPSLEITLNEVIPMIYEAAGACRPPLFKDQPQEKININSKLGFGMHDELKIDNEGETHWYTPMSCEKIKLHMPSLCIPCADCKNIGNPLTYYNRKRKLNLKNKKQNKG